MRGRIRRMAGWLHAVLLLASVLPVFYALGREQTEQAESALYAKCLVIAVPVVLSDFLSRRCRSIWQYIVGSAALLALTGFGAWQLGASMTGDFRAVYTFYLLLETAVVLAVRFADRLGERAARKSAEQGETDRRPPYRLLDTPEFPVLIYFFLMYILGKNIASAVLCDAAAVSTVLYFFVAVCWHYIGETEQYLFLHKRVSHLPGKRIYGIGALVLGGLALALLPFVLVTALTASHRQYRDIRNWNWNIHIEPEEFLPETGMDGGAEISEELLSQLQAGAEPPEWLNTLFYGIGILIFLACVAAAVRALRNLSRTFRENRDENGDIVEDLGEEPSAVETVKPVRAQGPETEREKIRRQYRKTIRRHRKEKPKPSATPSEIEEAAGLSDSREMGELHERYEWARYSKTD